MNLAVLENRLANPKQFEKDFFDFWDALNVKTVQEKTLAEQTRYDSVAVVTGITTLFESEPVADNTNLTNFTPPESEHQLITQIRIWEATNAVIADSVWTAGVTSGICQNSKISIINNGITVLDNVPLTEFLPDLTTRDIGLYDLAEPIAWVGQTNLIVQIKSKKGAIIGANSNLRVGLKGLAYIS